MYGYYSHLEEYILDLYKSISINKPEDLNINNIAKKLYLNLRYGSMSFRFGNHLVIKKATSQQEWQDFGHEICHYLRHHGNQLDMHPLFIDLQENQADYFAYHFCVPTFMLDDLKEVSVYDIMNKFNVEYDFALRRLEMYRNKLMDWRNYRERSYS